MKSSYPEHEQKMQKTIDVLEHDLSTIRAGRANSAVLDRISIDYYGAQTPLAQVASISSPDARTLVIQPWDMGCLKLIEKAIQTSDLGINPQNDGKIIRLCFPPLTEERRQELTKQVKSISENAKVAVRNIRRDAMEIFKDQKKKSEMTEDDYKSAESDIQEMTDKYCKQIDAVVERKEKELLSV